MTICTKTFRPANVKPLARLFSTKVIRELSSKERPSLFIQLLYESGLLEVLRTNTTVSTAFEYAFDILCKRDYRHEYIYKAALLEKIQYGTHSLNSACMVNEFRVETSKADTVLFNGTATAYEIKSERDSLSRLTSQYQDYFKVFPTVNVIAGENHIESLLNSTPSHLGVLCLSRRYRISTVREAIPNYDNINAESILNCIQVKEAKLMLELLDIEVPEVPNTLLSERLTTIFANIQIEQLHATMVNAIKINRTLKPLENFLAHIPYSLQSAVISAKLQKNQKGPFINSLTTPIYSVI